jgi:hypothetical protein
MFNSVLQLVQHLTGGVVSALTGTKVSSFNWLLVAVFIAGFIVGFYEVSKI